MTAASPAFRVVSVVVHIWMETTHPPTGRVVSVEGEPAQPFAGWLELLTILSDALEPAPAPLTRPSGTESEARGGM
jgi:hypothetical protein